MERTSEPKHWLDRYVTGYHRWQRMIQNESKLFVRPLGLVETSFDHDGSKFEGRADVNLITTCEIRTTLSAQAIQSHILHVWAALRAQHALLRAHVQDASKCSQLASAGLRDRCFAIVVPNDVGALVQEARRTINFLADFYHEVDPELFLRHAMNTARCMTASESLSQLFVLPLESLGEDRYTLQTLLVCAHEIVDGATCYGWGSHFVNLLNQQDSSLMHILTEAQDMKRLWAILPPAQEDLYPKIKATKARQRWFWAISRILRHVRKPPMAAFLNPLRKEEPLSHAEAMRPIFSKVLNYSVVPPLNSFVQSFQLSVAATKTLHRLCREANTSIGAGGFALVAMALMDIYEDRFPNIPLNERKAFVASFPLNPRPFLDYHGPLDSAMLMFSDGISIPFLPSYLPREGRFKLLVKQAHRELGIYQKRPRAAKMEAQLGARSASQLIPGFYVAFVERIEKFLHEDGNVRYDPQGDYPANFGATQTTCGVSSVGSTAAFLKGLHHNLDGTEPFQADFRSMQASVRAGDNEFLCGMASGAENFEVNAAFDGNYIDENAVASWAGKMKNLLEPVSLPKI
jgi:hypothetical protein